MKKIIKFFSEFIFTQAFLLVFLFVFFNEAKAAQVTSTGSFTETIPIEIPSPIVGPKPEVSLSYNSGAGNGIAGIGWGLSGLSAITRDPRYPINFDINDHYVFNGQKLIYNPADETYHSERENYLRLQRVNPNTSESYWIVTKKDGTKLYFGNTSDSSIDAIGKGQPLLWALSKVEDMHGNFYTIEYDEDTVNGDYYPKKISYNLTTQNNGLPVYTIDFVLESRPDHAPGYNPSFFDRDKRLKNIEVKVNNQPYIKYALTYDGGSFSGSSRLTSVKYFKSDTGNTVRIFGFDASKDSFNNTESKGNYTATLPTQKHLVNFADMNNDGYADISWIEGNQIKVKLNNKNGFSSDENVWGTISQNGPADSNLTHWGDVTGDGLTDLAWVNGKFLFFMRNNGEKFENQVLGTTLVSTPRSLLNQNPIWADFNSDGLTDFGWTSDYNYRAGFTQNGLGVHIAAINKGGRFEETEWSTNQTVKTTYNYNKTFRILTGLTSMTYNTTPYLSQPVDLSPNYTEIVDVTPNPNGYVELVQTAGAVSGTPGVLQMVFNNIDQVIWYNLPVSHFLPKKDVVKYHIWEDLNNDGLVDLIWVNNEGKLKVWRAMQGPDYTEYTFNINTVLPSLKDLTQIADFNNDGRKDFAWLEGNSVKVLLNDYTRRDTHILDPTVRVWATSTIALPNSANAIIGWKDINGDREIDFTWLDSQSRQIYSMQSKGLRSEPEKLVKEYALDWRYNLPSTLTQNSFTQAVWGNGITLKQDKGHLNAQLADVTGDGKTDLFFRQSNSSFKMVQGMAQVSPQTPTDWTTAYDTNLIEPTYGAPPHIFDITGEGLPDFLYSTGFTQTQNFIFHKNSGNGFETSKTNWGGIGPIGNGNGVSIESPYFLSVLINNFGNKSKSDFNGDGLSDVLIKDATQQGSKHALVKSFVFLNDNGNGLKPRQDWGQILPITKHYVSTFVKTVTGDLNGDGMSDVLNFYADFPELKVMISEGNKFRGNMFENWGVYPFFNAHAESGENSQYYAGLHDMNGDGKDDFVYKDTGAKQIMIMLSTGAKFLSPISWGTYENNVKPSDQNTFRDGFADINGDGLEDFVYISGTSLKVMPNTGTSFLGSVAVASWTDTITSSDYAFNSGLSDINGDGRLDFVYRSGNQIKVMVNQIPQSVRYDLMNKVKNSSGGSFEVSYDNARNFQGAVSSENSQYPRVANSSGIALVKELTLDDGMAGRSTTQYEYHNSLFKMGKREDRKSLGFEWVKKINPDNSYTKTWYIQDEDLASLDDEEFERLVKMQENYGSDDRLYAKTQNDYDSRLVFEANGQKSKFVFLKSTTSSVYGENDIVPVVTKTDYEYDKDESGADLSPKYGLVTKVTSFGQTDFDKTEKKTKHAVNSANYVFAPYETSTYGYSLDDQWVLDSKTTNYFDYSNTLGFVEKGLVTKKIRENNDKDAEENYVYDSLGRIATYTDPNSHSTGTSYVLTDDGNYIVTSTNTLNHASSVTSDLFGRVIKTTDANNISSKTEYHSEFPWLVVKEFAYENDTLPTVEYEYNFSDKVAPTVVKVIGKKAEKETANDNSQNVQSGQNGARSVEEKDTRPVVYTYSDGIGRTIQTKSLWKKVDGVNDEWQTVDTYYDTSGRAFKTSIPYLWKGIPSMDTTTLDGQKHIIAEFDAIGRNKKTTKPDNTFTRAIYGKNYVLNIDEKGHVTKTENLGSEINTYEYEAVYPENGQFDQNAFYSKTTTINRADGTKTIDPKRAATTIKKDMLGNVIEKDHPDTGKWTYRYDLAGNLNLQTDARTTEIIFVPDSLNRITDKMQNLTPLAKYYYDEEGKGASKGKLTTVNYNDDSGKAIGSESFVYDAKGRIKEKTVIIDGISKTFQYAYDTQNKVTGITYPHQETVTNHYYGSGNLKDIESSTHGSLISKIDYNILGQINQKNYGNGVIAGFKYYDETNSSAEREQGKNDFSYALKLHTVKKGDSVLFSQDLEYYPNLQISQTKDTKNASENSTKGFVYDFVNRVKSAVTEILGKINPAKSEETAQYDKAGNIENKSTVGYTYKTGTNKLDTVGEFTFEHDANGNITKKIKNGETVTTYTYSVDNQLVKIEQNGLVSEFVYFDGARVKKTENGKTIYYFSPDFQVTKDTTNDSACSTVNYFEHGLIFAQSTTCENQEAVILGREATPESDSGQARMTVTELTYLLHNYQGSTVATTDKDGNLIREYNYDLFGKQMGGREEPTPTTSTTPTPVPSVSPTSTPTPTPQPSVGGPNTSDKWYVHGTIGSDDSAFGNGTREFPFATIQKAVDSASANHTIYIMPVDGHKYNPVVIPANKDRLTITNINAIDSSINGTVVISAYSTGRVPVVSLTGTSSDPLENVTIEGDIEIRDGWPGVNMEYVRNSKIKGVKVIHNEESGIHIRHGLNNEISDNIIAIGFGIIWNDGILLENTENTQILRNDINMAIRGIRLENAVNTTIKYNNMHDNYLNDINTGGDSQSSGITISQNSLWQNNNSDFRNSAIVIWPGDIITEIKNNNFCGTASWYIRGPSGVKAPNNYFGICGVDGVLIRNATEEEIGAHMSNIVAGGSTNPVDWQPALSSKVDITVPIIEPTPTPTVIPTPTPTPSPTLIPTSTPSPTPTPSPSPSPSPTPTMTPSPSTPTPTLTPTLTPTPTPAPSEQGLILHYKFENTLIDSSSSLINGVRVGSIPSFVSGIDGKAVSLGGNTYVSLGKPAMLDFKPKQDDFTISAWVKTTDKKAGAIISKSDNSVFTRAYTLSIWNNGTVDVKVGGAMWNSQKIVSDGVWHHIALVNYTEGQTKKFKVYIDGLAQGQSKASGAGVNQNDVLIGANMISKTLIMNKFKGLIDEVKVYNRALDNSQINQLYRTFSSNGPREDLNIPSPSPSPSLSPIPSPIAQLYCGKTINQFARVIQGTERIDTLIGTAGNDLIFGFGGIDTIMGKGDNDCIYGGAGIDTIYGGDGDDILYGEAGIDTIFGDNGNDNLYGGDGIDYLHGGQGNDTLDGGLANDTCVDPSSSTPKISCER